MKRRAQLKPWALFAAIALLLPAIARAADDRSRSPLADAKELAKPVTYTETKIPLSELVQKVAAETGIPLTAAREVADEPVAVVVNQMPARELLEQVADLLDYTWSRRTSVVRSPYSVSGKGGPASVANTDHALRTTHYEIYQDLASKQREEALRQARVAEVMRQLQEELKADEEIAALPPEQFQRLADSAPRYWQEWWALPPEQQAARLKEPEVMAEQQRYGAVQALRAPIPRALATLLSAVSPAQWGPLLGGEAVTWSSDPKAGELRLPPDVERRLRDTTPTWLPLGGRLAFPEPGEEERMRQQERALQEAWAAASGYRVTLRLDARQLPTRGTLMLSISAAPFRSGAPTEGTPAELPPPMFSGTSLTVSAGFRSALPPVEEQTAERRASLENDPILGVKREFKTAVKPQPNRFGPGGPERWSLWDLLPELGRVYGVDFIADSYWSSTPALSAVPREPTALYALLDRAAGPTHQWDRCGKLIRLRSRAWFLDRPREIPLRYVRRWKELVAEGGALPLESYLEIVTTLTDTQLESLTPLLDTAGLPSELSAAGFGRDLLRLYASLTPSQQQALRHGRIIPVSRMTPRQQALLVGAMKRLPRVLPAEEQAPEQLAAAGLSLTRVPMIRTIDRRSGSVEVSDEPAAAAPRPAAPAPQGVERFPVTQLRFLLAHGQEQRGGVAITTVEGGARPL